MQLMRSLPHFGVATGLLIVSSGLCHGQITQDPFGRLNDACAFERHPLQHREVARAHVPADLVEPMRDGWLAYSRRSGRLSRMDADLREVENWNLLDERSDERQGVSVGGGIPKSSRVIALVPMAPDMVGLVATSPATLFVLGPNGGVISRTALLGTPSDAIAVGSGLVVYGASNGIYGLDFGSGAAQNPRRLLAPSDFGMTVDPVAGLPPEFRVRARDDTLYVAWTAQSSIWAVDGEAGAPPRLVLQRCVPPELIATHQNAPRIALGTIDGIRSSITSIQDYLVLPSGEVLVLGALSVGPSDHRSIELYNHEGIRVRAWELPVPGAAARFHSMDPSLLVVFRSRGDKQTLRLLEIDGPEYPNVHR